MGAVLDVNITDPAGTYSGIAFRNYVSNDLTDADIKFEFDTNNRSVYGVWIHNPDISGTLTIDRISSEVVNPIPMNEGTSPTAVRIGSTEGSTNLITHIQADGLQIERSTIFN